MVDVANWIWAIVMNISVAGVVVAATVMVLRKTPKADDAA